MTTPAPTPRNKAGERRWKYYGKGICDLCNMQPATRLIMWSTACEPCSIARGLLHNPSDFRLALRIEKERFPCEHRGNVSCCTCRKENLTILYDEVDDEWLYCPDCKRFKQLLRCWNMYTNRMEDFLERPVIRPDPLQVKIVFVFCYISRRSLESIPIVFRFLTSWTLCFTRDSWYEMTFDKLIGTHNERHDSVLLPTLPKF
jgi:hypothetical protein